MGNAAATMAVLKDDEERGMEGVVWSDLVWCVYCSVDQKIV